MKESKYFIILYCAVFAAITAPLIIFGWIAGIKWDWFLVELTGGLSLLVLIAVALVFVFWVKTEDVLFVTRDTVVLDKRRQYKD